MEKQLLESISDGVAILRLNRSERLNALSTPIMAGLLEALPRLAQDPALAVVVAATYAPSRISDAVAHVSRRGRNGGVLFDFSSDLGAAS
jgi:hypothetical protein